MCPCMGLPITAIYVFFPHDIRFRVDARHLVGATGQTFGDGVARGTNAAEFRF